MTTVQETWNSIKALSKKSLYNLAHDYNFYVIEVCDRQDGSIPVCLPEYFMNDWEDKP